MPPNLDRRGFLAAAAGGAATLAGVAGLTGCGSGSSRAGAQTTSSAPSPSFRSRPDLSPPPIRVATRPAVVDNGNFVFTDIHAGTGQQGALIIDRGGTLQYFNPVSDNGSPGRRVFNVRVQQYRGQPVMTYFLGAVVSGHGQGHYHLFDQRYREVAQVHGHNGYYGDLHEFRLTDRGTALFTAYGRALGEITSSESRGGSHRGPYFYGVAQEVDVATGKLLFQWRSDEHVSFAASYRLPAPSSTNVTWDYFHINSIEVDPADGNLIISGRNAWAFYKVHRDTGKVLWSCGGRDSDFDMGPGTHFAFQHHVVPHPNGIYTIFDNEGGPPNESSQSRGLIVHLDEKRRQVRLVRQFHHVPAILSTALGSVQPLPGGNVFMGWGTSTYFTEYDSSGKVVLDARLEPIGTNSYRAFQNAWRGQPDEPPRIAVDSGGPGATIYVSWNGATVHRSWQVLGGSGPGALSPIATAQVAGFETQIRVAHPPKWVAVQALDATGHPLGVSAAAQV